jgi:hypothetical protein
MEPLDLFYVTLSVCVVLLTGVLLAVLWQAGRLLATVRCEVLGRTVEVLEEVKANLRQVETLTRDVDVTVSHTNEIVDTVRRGVRGLEEGLDHAGRTTTAFFKVKLAAASRGVAAGWSVLVGAARRGPQPPLRQQPETCAGDAKTDEVADYPASEV